MSRVRHESIVAASLAVGMVGAALASVALHPAQARVLNMKDVPGNPLIERLYQDHLRASGGAAYPGYRPAGADARIEKVRKTLAASQLYSGHDYLSAAVLLHQSERTSDQLLAHDLAVIAVAKGQGHAAFPMIGRSLDAYSRLIEEPERYGSTTGKPAKDVPHGMAEWLKAQVAGPVEKPPQVL